MTLVRSLVAIAAVTVGLASAASAQATMDTLRRGPACDRGATVLRSQEARVRRAGDLLFGCFGRATRGRELERTGCITGFSTSLPLCVVVARPVLSGRWLAYATRVEQADLDAWLDISSVRVVDLRRGRRWTYDACPGSWSVTSASQTVTYHYGLAAVRRMLVTPTGTAVFSARDRRDPAKGNLICVARPGRGATVVLAESRGIDVTSLRISGASVTWRDAGVLQSAALP